MIVYLTSPLTSNILLVIGLFGLSFAILAEQAQLLAKHHGSITKHVAQGYNLAMKIMVANRFGAVIYSLLIAFNIDNGLAPSKLATGYAVTITLLAIPTIIMLIILQKTIKDTGSKIHVLDRSHWPHYIVIATFLAISFNLLGFTLPWLAGAAYPDMRLTLANTSFLFNTIFTMINVFFVEHHFAKLVDSDKNEIHGFAAGVLIARLTAYVMVGLSIFYFNGPFFKI